MASAGAAIVTGASRNIGRAVAIRLAAAGHPVAAVSHSFRSGLDETCEAIRAGGGTAAAFTADLSETAEIDRLVEEISAALGPVSVLVHTAAIRPSQPLLHVHLEDWRHVMATNLESLFLLSKAVLPMMLEQEWGRIVGFSGLLADRGSKPGGAVSASKLAIVGLIRSIAQEFAGSGITANVVLPGDIDTDGKPPLSNSSRGVPPVGRRGTVEEIAEACAYLVSPAAGFTTGQTLSVTGGQFS